MAYKNVNMHKWKLHLTANRCDKKNMKRGEITGKKEARWIFIIHEINFFVRCVQEKKIPRVLTTKRECRKSFCLTFFFSAKQILRNDCFYEAEELFWGLEMSNC